MEQSSVLQIRTTKPAEGNVPKLAWWANDWVTQTELNSVKLLFWNAPKICFKQVEEDDGHRERLWKKSLLLTVLTATWRSTKVGQATEGARGGERSKGKVYTRAFYYSFQEKKWTGRLSSWDRLRKGEFEKFRQVLVYRSWPPAWPWGDLVLGGQYPGLQEPERRRQVRVQTEDWLGCISKARYKANHLLSLGIC